MLAGSLIMTGMIVAQIGAFVWWVDREVADPERLEALAGSVVRDDEFRAAVTPEISSRLLDASQPFLAELQDAALAESGIDPANAATFIDSAEIEGATIIDEASLAAAVDAALIDPAVVAELSRAIAQVASTVIGSGDETITVSFDDVHSAVVRALDDVDPELARQVGEFTPPEPLELDVSRFPDLGTPFAALTLAWMILIGAGLTTAVVGMVVHPKPAKGLRRIGLLIAVGAGVQVGLVWVLTDVVVTNLPGDGLATAGAVGLRIVLEGWRVQAFVQLALGVVIAAIGLLWLWIPMVPGRRHPAPV